MMTWSDCGVRFFPENIVLWDNGSEFTEVVIVAALGSDYYHVRPLGASGMVRVHADYLHAPIIYGTELIV